ncbi:innexin inx7-like [Ctenocephalides felis]|nr:innexin inx7-like [Ctenocephalides felis]
MLMTFQVLKDQAKHLNKSISIDNAVCKLHYRVTFMLLMACTVLVTSRQYIGEHIKCILGQGPAVPQHVLETFCFFTSTYTAVKHLNQSMINSGHIPHPGIGPSRE